MPQQSKDAAIKVLHKKKDRTESGNYGDMLLVGHAGKGTPQSYHGSPYIVTTAIFCWNNVVGSNPSARRLT